MPGPSRPMPAKEKPINASKVDRLATLADFLKSCRTRTTPESWGLPIRPRRRSVGLSRAEVATLATISVDWYTWLEQGRDIQPSVQVVDSLADVFRLTPVEKRHLYTLTEHASGSTVQPETADLQIMHRLISCLPAAPAIVLSKDWRILAQNSAADEFFGTWLHQVDPNLVPSDRNRLRA